MDISKGCTPEEIRLLYNIECECFEPAMRWTEADFAETLAKRRWTPTHSIEIWVARIEGKPVGFLLGGERRGEAHLVSVGVVPRLRGKGIGKKLIFHFEQHYRGKELQLEVHPNNPAQTLYFKLDYRIVGFKKDYYPNGDSCICMAKPRRMATTCLP